MNTQQLIAAYKQALGWSDDEVVERLSEFLDAQDMVRELRDFMRKETGVDPFPHYGYVPHGGKEYAVLAFGPGETSTNEAAERVDTDTEVFALEAFSELLARPDLEEFVIIQFSSDTMETRELLRYDRRTSVGRW